MAVKTDNLPLNMDTMDQTGNSITYANEVIAIIAGVAASEVEGIAGMSAASGISDILGRNRNITRGVKVEIGPEEASVDLYIIVEYGTPIQQASKDAQESVRKAIETMTGLKVVRVDIHVQGVSFEKENKAISAGREKAALPAGKGKNRKPDKKAVSLSSVPDEVEAPAEPAAYAPETSPETSVEEMAAETAMEATADATVETAETAEKPDSAETADNPAAEAPAGE